MTILERLRSYFGHGGLINPEMMDHEKVRLLLWDIQIHLTPQPIETAPKTGHVLLFNKDEGWEVGFWGRVRGWREISGVYEIFPTHWLPLPHNP